MSAILSLERLFDAVAERFSDDGTAADNHLGWREPAKSPTGPRITWAPGDPAGNLGELGGAVSPGRVPRPLATLNELVTVELQAVDVSARENERAQYHAARVLFDAWYRAVYLAAHGTFTVRSVAWMRDRTVRVYGACIRCVLELQSAVLDEPAGISAPTDTGADIEIEELDLTEHETITAVAGELPDEDEIIPTPGP